MSALFLTLSMFSADSWVVYALLRLFYLPLYMHTHICFSWTIESKLEILWPFTHKYLNVYFLFFCTTMWHIPK